MAMRIQLLYLGLWNIIQLFMLLNLASSNEDFYTDFAYPPPLVFEYKRFPEVADHCGGILSSGSKLDFDLNDTEVQRIKNELSFRNGDWEQENDGLAPLMPSDFTDMPQGTSSASLRLINFEVKDIKSLEGLQNGVGVGGVMSIGITRSKSFISDLTTRFFMKPGMNVLTVVFEGVYVETKGFEGERLLCLLGNTTLPSRRWLLEWQNEYWSPVNRCPKPVQDDQLMLVLKYPKMFNITSREIQGEMRSMRERNSFRFFDKVIISSQLGPFSDYQFSSSQSSLCNAHALQEELLEDGGNNLSGSEFCKIFQEVSNKMLNVLPDFHLDESRSASGNFGPFVLENEVLYVYGEHNYTNMKLAIQNVKCKEEDNNDAKVSAVFRLVPSLADRFTASFRTALSGLTLSAEGVWDSSEGLLCMIGSVPKGMEAKVSMYFPRALSIRQRSIIFGSIEGLFSPLQFNLIQKPYLLELWYGWYVDSYLSYNYSKIKHADEFRKRRHPINTISSRSEKNIVSNSQLSVLKYPSIQEVGGFFSLSQIYDLTDELYIDTGAANTVAGISIQLELVSIGPYLARYDFLYKVRHEGILADARTLFNENGLLNISLHLIVSEELPVYGISNTILFMEGLYNPGSGEMYLIGCGKVDRGAQADRDLDCLIEVEIQYPPMNSRWLRDPTVKISIVSQREPHDPLYNSPIEIESKTIAYNIFKQGTHEEDVAFRKIFEGVLRVLFLLVEIALTWSQKLYMDRNVGLASSVCLNMFALQIFSFSFLLISGGEILLPSKETMSYKNQSYQLQAFKSTFIGLHYATKVLALIALFLNGNLFCKVSKSSKMLNEDEPVTLQNWRLFLSLLKRFAFICLIFLIIILSIPNNKGTPIIEIVQVQMVVLLTKLAHNLHDFSLVPQIVENWRLKQQVKSLRKFFYIGLPFLKIILKLYDGIRGHISDPYIMNEPTKVNLFGMDILALISQVIIVHVQQNLSYFWLIDWLKVLNPWKLKQLFFKFAS